MKNPVQYLALFLTLLPFSSALAQFESVANSDRKSMTVLYVEEPKGAGPLMVDQLPAEFKSRFDWNIIPVKSVKPFTSSLESVGYQLSQKGVAREIIAAWWNRQPDGSFRLDTLAARGRYNASDYAQRVAKDGVRGISELEEAGLRLIPNSYVLVVYPKNLKTMEEHYDEIDRRNQQNNSSDRVDRTERGYTGYVEGYLYKLVWDDAVKNEFYNMWIDESDSEEVKQSKKKQFDQYNFRLEPIKAYGAGGLFEAMPINATATIRSGSNDEKAAKLLLDLTKNNATSRVYDANSSMEELLRGWAGTAIGKVMEKVMGSKAANLAFSTTVSDTRPVQSRIGKKEGVYPEKMYYVYERVQKANGSVGKRRVGAVRAKTNVTDNRGVATGDTRPSKFRRVGGMLPIRQGMLLEERREKGVGIHILYTPLTLESDFANNAVDLGAGLEFNISLLAGKSGAQRFPGGLKLGLNYTVSPEDIEIDGDNENGTAAHFAGYLRKDMHLTVFRLGLWAGYGVESVEEKTSSDNAEKVKTSFIPLGAELGLNITPKLNLFAQGEYVYPFGEITDDDGNSWENADGDDTWKEVYPNRDGMSLRAGLRFSF